MIEKGERDFIYIKSSESLPSCGKKDESGSWCTLKRKTAKRRVQRDFRTAICSGFLPFHYKHREIGPNGRTTAALEREQPRARLCAVEQQLPFAVPAVNRSPESAAPLRNQRPGSHHPPPAPSPYRNRSFFPSREKESRPASRGGQELRGGDPPAQHFHRASPRPVSLTGHSLLVRVGRRSYFNPVQVSKGICVPTRRKIKNS